MEKVRGKEIGVFATSCLLRVDKPSCDTAVRLMRNLVDSIVKHVDDLSSRLTDGRSDELERSQLVGQFHRNVAHLNKATYAMFDALPIYETFTRHDKCPLPLEEEKRELRTLRKVNATRYYDYVKRILLETAIYTINRNKEIVYGINNINLLHYREELNDDSTYLSDSSSADTTSNTQDAACNFRNKKIPFHRRDNVVTSVKSFEARLLLRIYRKSFQQLKRAHELASLQRTMMHCRKEEKIAQKTHSSAQRPTNTDVSLLQCSVCSRRFTKTFHYIQHVRMHYRLSTYRCAKCGKFFVQQNGRDYHERKCSTISIRQVVFSRIKSTVFERCDSCDRFFRNGNEMSNHVIRHHAKRNIELGINKNQMFVIRNWLHGREKCVK